MGIAGNDGQLDQEVLYELNKLHKENQEGHSHTKMSLERVKQTVKHIKEQINRT